MALYIDEHPWWTTNVEMEAALAPHEAFHDFHFFADKLTLYERHCVASLSFPPALHHPDTDFHAQAPSPAPNPNSDRNGNTTNMTTTRGNVGSCWVIGLRPAHRQPNPSPHLFGSGLDRNSGPNKAQPGPKFL